MDYHTYWSIILKDKNIPDQCEVGHGCYTKSCSSKDGPDELQKSLKALEDAPDTHESITARGYFKQKLEDLECPYISIDADKGLAQERYCCRDLESPQPVNIPSTLRSYEEARDCFTISGPVSGKKCHFPFRYNGTLHMQCIKEDHDKLWCSTETNLNDDHVDGQWGNCGSCSFGASEICGRGGDGLVKAVRTGRIEEVSKLIRCPGVDINYKDIHGWTPLVSASFNGYLNIVDLLKNDPRIKVRQPGSVGFSPLFWASQQGHVEVVKTLLSHPDININIAECNRTSSPLYEACRFGNIEVVKVLLADPRVDPNQLVGSSLSTAIHTAAYWGKLDVVKILLRCPKVELGIKDTDGKDELDYAKEWVTLQPYPDIIEAIESRTKLLEMGYTC